MNNRDCGWGKEIEQSLFEYSALFSRGNVAKDCSLIVVNTGTAALNRVMGAALADNEMSWAIEAVKREFGGQPVTWIVGPGSKPDHLGQMLLGQGFRYLMEWTGMAYLHTQSPLYSMPAGFAIREADDPDAVFAWAQTAADGFRMPAAIARDFPTAYRRADISKCKCYLGYYQDEPVATACLHLGKAAGAYFISTLPEYRGRGYSQAITAHLVQAAYNAGYDKVVLQASSAGRDVYDMLGFTEICKMDTYALNF